jgi:hypothetical protein
MMQHVLLANKSTVIRAHPIGLPSPKYISGPNKKDVRGSILFSKYLNWVLVRLSSVFACQSCRNLISKNNDISTVKLPTVSLVASPPLLNNANLI